KFGVIDTYFLTDIPTVMAAMVSKGKIDAETARRIEKSQFRSFDYVPRLAKWLLDGVDVPTEVYPLENIEDVPQAVWWVDNFGNCKLSVVAEDIGHEQGKIIKTK